MHKESQGSYFRYSPDIDYSFADQLKKEGYTLVLTFSKDQGFIYWMAEWKEYFYLHDDGSMEFTSPRHLRIYQDAEKRLYWYVHTRNWRQF